MKVILIIEDEINIINFIRQGLEEEGYKILVAYDGQTGIEMLHNNHIDLVILDIIIPKINGFDVCKKIRDMGYKEIPILLLTALSRTDNIVKGLDMGADDYLTKPFKFDELKARIRTLLRRKNLTQEHSDVLSIADLELDQNYKTVKRADKEIVLTSTEFRLLEHFLMNPRKVMSRVDLLESVWGIEFNINTNVVDVYVNYLRNKIEKGFDSKLIHTVIGMGYMIKES
jgi:DNA-binding response OmpR family regulator